MSLPAVYPGPTAENLACIPQPLKAVKQWVLWRGVWRQDGASGSTKVTKVPVDPNTLTAADTTDPHTWGDYDICVQGLQVALEEWQLDASAAFCGGGIGFVFTADDPYVGVDLDHCVDAVTGIMADWATAIVAQITSYAELSPSAEGVHIIVEGMLPPRGRRKGAVEMYDRARFFTMTGWHVETSPPTIETPQIALSNLWCTLFAPQVGQTVWTVDPHGVIANTAPLTITAIEPAPTGELYARFAETDVGYPLVRCELAAEVVDDTTALALDDDEIVRRIKGAKNVENVIALIRGDWVQDYPSQSEADLALCCHLAFWTRDAAQIDRLFRTTRLLRDKWDERRGAQTYGQRTIAEALARQTEYYAPLPSMIVNSSVNSNGAGYVWGTPGSSNGKTPGHVWGSTELLDTTFLNTPPWPELSEDALYGLAATFVCTVAPYTETDPVALLLQFLIMFGNLVGRTPRAIVEADWHYFNLFGALVGETSKARKGSSYGHAKRMMTSVDPVWAQTRIMGGLSSGEGLIWNVRDPVYGTNKRNEEICLDEGIEDKRLFVFEPELARVLRVLSREGNTLSAIIRQAWDDGTLRTMVSGRRVPPVSATDAFVSILGHITVDELRRNLTETETSNGFANRFLWCCVRRAQLLPEGGRYPEKELQPLVGKLNAAVIAARKTGTMRRDQEARQRWADVYEKLSEGKPGLLGHVTARAEAQVLRLSSLYALLDQSTVIRVEHLNAALAFWQYCDDSAVYIFGDALGDATADDILQMLRAVAPQGMTRTEIFNGLGTHQKSSAIQAALVVLIRQQLVVYRKEDTSGRPIERWFARLISAYPVAEKAEKAD